MTATALVGYVASCICEAESAIAANARSLQGLAARVGLDVDDLKQIGHVAALECSSRFDPSKGVKFATFARHRIRGAMFDAIDKARTPPGEQTGELVAPVDTGEETPLRACLRCRVVRPATAAWFIVKKASRDGLGSTCRGCHRAQALHGYYQKRVKHYQQRIAELREKLRALAPRARR